MPKQSQKATGKSKLSDSFQTPDSAVDVLIPYIEPGATIWEPCAGQGYLARRLAEKGFQVMASELYTPEEYRDMIWDYMREKIDPDSPEPPEELWAPVIEGIKYGVDFLTSTPMPLPEYIITNFPFSIVRKCIARCIELDRCSWAGLAKLEVLGTAGAQDSFKRAGGIRLIVTDRRINYKPPVKPWGEAKGAWFPTAWFIGGHWPLLEGGMDIIFSELPRKEMNNG